MGGGGVGSRKYPLSLNYIYKGGCNGMNYINGSDKGKIGGGGVGGDGGRGLLGLVLDDPPPDAMCPVPVTLFGTRQTPALNEYKPLLTSSFSLYAPNTLSSLPNFLFRTFPTPSLIACLLISFRPPSHQHHTTNNPNHRYDYNQRQ